MSLCQTVLAIILGDLEHIEVSILIGYIFYFIQVYVISKKRYSYGLFTLETCVLHLSLLVLTFFIMHHLKPVIQYIARSLIIAFSVFFSIRILEQKLVFLQVLKKGLENISGIKN